VKEYWTSTAPSAEGGSFGDVGLAGAKTVIAALAPGHLAAIAGRAMDLPELSSPRPYAVSHPARTTLAMPRKLRKQMAHAIQT